MNSTKLKLGIVGVGKIVRDQHLPSIQSTGGFELMATASRNASVDGVRAYLNIEDMLDSEPDMQAIALCMPPEHRFAAAELALKAGKHVLLEKPPGTHSAEVELLAKLAREQSVSLYATWHSRHGNAVETAKSILQTESIRAVELNWKEDVRKWHPKQDWIWQETGFGVFDPGINGLSILTHLIETELAVKNAELVFPNNKDAPIAVAMLLESDTWQCQVDFDWRVDGDEVWEIRFTTESGSVVLHDGGARLVVNQALVEVPGGGEHGEYESIYRRFSELILTKHSDVDLRPLKIVEVALSVGERVPAPAFYD